jgi:putative DNA primase/helicase
MPDDPKALIVRIEDYKRVDGKLWVIDPAAPLDIARLFAAEKHTVGGWPALHHHRGAFYAWDGRCYSEGEEDALRAQLYGFLDQCVTKSARGEERPFKPNMARVGHIIDALKAASNLPGSISAPAWLDQTVGLAPEDIIACTNGLLHLPTLDLLPHTPKFFTHNALDFAFERNTPAPVEWLRFLSQLWPDDRQSIETLQEIFGYCLTANTAQQKAFLIVGPKRSGKGTIGRVMRRVAGAENVVAPTLATLSTNFGLAPLIGKRLAIISDARLGGRADQHAIAERLLSITGEDAITIDRKYRNAWTGRVQTRFIILSNELPQLADASGAMPSRFVVLVLTTSFYGREDLGLTDCLLCERPGILNWSITGLNRLRHRGHFVQPASASEAVQHLEDLGSPISAFIRDRCRIGPEYRVDRTLLFEEWRKWSAQQGFDKPGTQASFGKSLMAAFPGLGRSQPREEGKRLNLYQGIGIKW